MRKKISGTAWRRRRTVGLSLRQELPERRSDMSIAVFGLPADHHFSRRSTHAARGALLT
ncbi:hypothetical protein [Nocardioides sp.]|uniref:hypothetical protein n=1 Tax=Nocardioides sp. TaxID=35761 RepID=UPI002C4189FE|nr:hypothetical protein [Nocardioides sp.]HSX67899.1 hypothetical protein [Nocardioides sp.]